MTSPIQIQVTAQPGQAQQIVIDIVGEAAPVAPEHRMLLGMSGLPGAEWQSYLAAFPVIEYTRDFGKDNLYKLPNGQYDPDAYTEWTKWGTGKWLNAPANMVNHLSVKDDADEFLDQWADSFPAALPAGFQGTILSPWHEPEDDVRAGTITWEWLRQQGRDIVSWRDRHPRGRELVRAVGPILTRWDIVDLNNNPANAGFEGMTHFFFDTYQSETKGRYYTPAEMIDEAAARIHAVYPGIPLGIPESGFAKQSNDTSGTARAAAIRALVEHCRTRGDIDFFSYFNSVGSIPTVPFGTTGPEADTYRALLVGA